MNSISHIAELLRAGGFSEKEVLIYQAILTLGPCVVSDLAKSAGVNRSTAYVVLDALAKRGLVELFEDGKVKKARLKGREGLANYFEKKAEGYRLAAKTAKRIIPKISPEKHRTESEATVRLFNDEKGTREAFAQAIHSFEEIRLQASGETGKKELSPGVNIYGDKVIFLSPNKKSGFMIENQAIASELKKALGTS